MTENVYHFTDTVRLPWILKDGVLRPGRNKVGKYPDPDFLWATTSTSGDRSASCASSGSAEGYRSGLTRLVRFTLRREDFVPWPEITRDFPAWTLDHIKRLERAADSKSSPTTWWCRLEPLATRNISIETRSYLAPVWKPLTNIAATVDPINEALGVVIEGRLYLSKQIVGANSATKYAIIAGGERFDTTTGNSNFDVTEAHTRNALQTWSKEF